MCVNVKNLFAIFPLTLSLYVSFYPYCVDTDQNQILYLAHTACFALFFSFHFSFFLSLNWFSVRSFAFPLKFTQCCASIFFLLFFMVAFIFMCFFAFIFSLLLMWLFAVRFAYSNFELMPDNKRTRISFATEDRNGNDARRGTCYFTLSIASVQCHVHFQWIVCCHFTFFNGTFRRFPQSNEQILRCSSSSFSSFIFVAKAPLEKEERNQSRMIEK